MQLFFDFLPILLFFPCYKFYGIYIATVVLMITTVAQLIFIWYKYRQLKLTQIITTLIVLLLGSITVWLQNELFIKWKPTVVSWIFAVLFFASQWFSAKPFIQRMLEEQVQLPDRSWQRLNLSWGCFFSILGMVNLYVAYHFSTAAWVNFKAFWLLGSTVLFGIGQSWYIAKQLTKANKSATE